MLVRALQIHTRTHNSDAALSCVVYPLTLYPADVNARRTVTGLTALQAACEANNPQMVAAVLAAKPNLEMRKTSGSKQTALLICAGMGWAKCLELLIEAGGDTEATFMYRGKSYTGLTDALDELSRSTGPYGCDWQECVRLLATYQHGSKLLAVEQRLAFATSTCFRLARDSPVYQELPLREDGGGDLHDMICCTQASHKLRNQPERAMVAAVLKRWMA